MLNEKFENNAHVNQTKPKNDKITKVALFGIIFLITGLFYLRSQRSLLSSPSPYGNIILIIMTFVISLILYGMKYKNLNETEKLLNFIVAVFCPHLYIVFVFIASVL